MVERPDQGRHRQQDQRHGQEPQRPVLAHPFVDLHRWLHVRQAPQQRRGGLTALVELLVGAHAGRGMERHTLPLGVDELDMQLRRRG
ncbi:hypothetical protein DFP85_11199 [Halomonas ventosae]|uniref:Uncharacterized protein n=1 Tax=Halomonas ventosae TaxID=229007 RepID=A0A4R6ZKI8_9GAMM|nr:hypothetical protein [Halomonas ventosae]TDR52775.1 hypothetical protein DFP85_11199 [Halomonas ventosae]